MSFKHFGSAAYWFEAEDLLKMDLENVAFRCMQVFVIIFLICCVIFGSYALYEGIYLDYIKPGWQCHSICHDLDLEHVRTNTIMKECVCANDIVAKPWKVTTMDVYEKI